MAKRRRTAVVVTVRKYTVKKVATKRRVAGGGRLRAWR